MSTGLVSFLNTTIIFDIPPRPEGATEMPYTKFRVGFGFNAVGAIGHRKLAGFRSAIVQRDEDSK
jgi:hypothetical protein